MNFKFIFLSVLVLGLIVNTSSFSDLAFADKPDKEDKKEGQGQKKIQNADAKSEREEKRADAKSEREEKRADAKSEREEIKIQKKEVKEFGEDVVVTSSSSTICHIPPGNPGNNRTLHVGPAAVKAHVDNHGDPEKACEDVVWMEFEYMFEDQEVESDENLIAQISQQIENLRQMLQQIIG